MIEREDDNRIVFLFKSMEKKYVEDTMNKGRFCFNHPVTFSQWEDVNSAQFDRWEAHSAYEAIDLMVFPIIGDNNGIPKYGPGKKLADKAIVHTQTDSIKHSPICCFRAIDQSEVEFKEDVLYYSLGETALRIKREFGHDAFVIIKALPFLIRLKSKVNSFMAMSVAYYDLLNSYQFDVEERFRASVEQLYRKDKKYEWQKEYRIVLPPTQESPVFVEVGSINDIAIYGDLNDLI